MSINLKDIAKELEDTLGGKFNVRILEGSEDPAIITEELVGADREKCIRYLEKNGIEPLHDELVSWQATALLVDNLREEGVL